MNRDGVPHSLDAEKPVLGALMLDRADNGDSFQHEAAPGGPGHGVVIARFLERLREYDGPSVRLLPYAQAAFLVVLNVADWRGGRFFLSAGRLARAGRMSKDSAKRSLRLLCELGVIRLVAVGGFDRASSRNQANTYDLAEAFRPLGGGCCLTGCDANGRGGC